MIKVLELILTILGTTTLVISILNNLGVNLGISPWVLIILGITFFFAGICLLKHRKGTDQTLTVIHKTLPILKGFIFKNCCYDKPKNKKRKIV